MKRLIGMMMVVTGGALFVVPGHAHAGTHYGYDDNGHQYIGKVTHYDPGVGANVTSQWLCDDGPAADDDAWTNLGDSTSLTAGWDIYGDDSAAGCSHLGGAANCDDTMEIIRSNTTIAGDCAATSGTWSALAYGAYYVDIHGDADDDSVFGGAGSTYAYGDAGDDYMYQYSGTGRTYGGADVDNLFGNAGSGDVLYGDAGSDCLQDASNSWGVYNCGTDSDTWYYTNTAAGKVSCDNPEYFCCGYC